MRMRYRSCREDIVDLGDLAFPLDQALEDVARDEIVWAWTL